MTHTLGLLFDIDGTLVETDRLHYDAFLDILAPHGRTLSLSEFEHRIVGQPNDAIMDHLFPELDRASQDALADRKEHLFRQSVRKLTPTDGLREVLAWADENAVPVGVVTNAPRPNGEMMLHGLGLSHLVTRLVIGPELARPKPDPLPYTTGAALIGVDPARIVAFEDSTTGVTSAAGAGLWTVGLTRNRSALLRAAGARHIATDFNDPALWSVLRGALAGGPLELAAS
jgi:beta-phosphoglucomutase